MTPKVAFSMSFFDAYAAMPKKVQKKVRSFVEKFKADPTSAAIHYESLEGMRDDKVRTVRIGLDYRAIVIHPPKGDVFLLVWVDHHDEAMQWAAQKRFEVNAYTGALQVYEMLPGGAPDAEGSGATGSGATGSGATGSGATGSGATGSGTAGGAVRDDEARSEASRDDQARSEAARDYKARSEASRDHVSSPGAHGDGSPTIATERASTVEPTIAPDVVPGGRLFAGTTRDDLLLLGVPVPLVPAVFAVRTEADLDQLVPYLPSDAADGLYLVAAGDTIEAALAELEIAKGAATIDTEDFERALARAPSGGAFALVEDDDELAAMLDAPLEKWRLFLHPSQRRLVTLDAKGPTRVLGGAGTGKTVVAMHRARFLARKEGLLAPGAKILFTTFTRNLAIDIGRHLDQLCGVERERIEVTNVHQLAASILKNDAGLRFGLVPDRDAERLLEDILRERFVGERPGPADPRFYWDELRTVVLAQDVETEADYLRAKRTGRGTRLSRGQRRQIWAVFEEHRARLQEDGKITYADCIREARRFVESGLGGPRYAAVVADEVQDLSLSELRFLRALVPEGPNDLFLVGDTHQRIYGHKASLGAAGINVRGRRSNRLRLNYRTTQAIRRFAIALYRGVDVDDLDEGKDEGKDFRSLRVGPPPRVAHFATEAEEERAVAAQVRDWLATARRVGRDVALVVPSSRDRERYRAALEHLGLPSRFVSREGDDGHPEAVRIATMHRVKGLEFPCVWVTGVDRLALDESSAAHASPGRASYDEGALADRVHQDRNLLYVACTRARDELVVSSAGPTPPNLPR